MDSYNTDVALPPFRGVLRVGTTRPSPSGVCYWSVQLKSGHEEFSRVSGGCLVCFQQVVGSGWTWGVECGRFLVARTVPLWRSIPESMAGMPIVTNASCPLSASCWWIISRCAVHVSWRGSHHCQRLWNFSHFNHILLVAFPFCCWTHNFSDVLLRHRQIIWIVFCFVLKPPSNRYVCWYGWHMETCKCFTVL